MRNGWTGGQYSLLRSGFGIWLGWSFVRLGAAGSSLAREASWLLAGIGLLSGVAIVLGWRDRVAPWIVIACLLALPDRGSIVLAWPLVAHALIPRAPYGSLTAAGREDPGGGWVLPDRIFAATWAVIGVLFLGPMFIGAMPHPLVAGTRIAWLPLGAFRKTRPWIWAAALLAQFGWALSQGTAYDSALLVVLWFAFDPGWIRPALPGLCDLVFFDGNCGLCHRAVRFLVAEDGTAARFAFAPLDGDTFRTLVPAAQRSRLPDTLVLRDPDGRLWTRSEAALRASSRLGGLWRALAVIMRLLPRRSRDAAYDGVAGRRHRIFSAPDDSCPAVPIGLRDRLLP